MPSLLSIAFTFFIIQFNKPSDASPSPQGALRISLLEEFDVLHPYASRSDASNWLSGFVQRPILYVDSNRSLTSHLLEGLPEPELIRKNSLSEVGMQIKLKFKKNASWGDGVAVTGEDLIYTMEILQKEFPEVMASPPWSAISKISINTEDKAEFTLHFRSKAWENIYSLQKLWLLPAHIERPLFISSQKSPGAYKQTSPYFNKPTLSGLYNGPWIIKEFVRGRTIHLARNPGFLPQARISDIVISLIPHWGDVENLIKNKQTEIIASPGLTTDLFRRIKFQIKHSTLPYTLLTAPGTSWEHLDFQIKNKELENPLLRKAMIMSFNKRELAEKIWDSYASYTSHYIHPQDPWYMPPPSECDELAYNPESAKKIFEALGFRQTKKGLVNQKNGEVLTILLMSNNESRSRKETTRAIKEQWEKLGIDTKIRLIPGKIFFQDVLRKASFPGIALYAWKKPFPFNPIETFDLSAIPDQKNGYSGQNLTGWQDKQMESFLKLLKNEWTLSRQVRINEQIIRRFCEESPSVSLWFQPAFSIIHNHIKNYRNIGYTFPSPYSSEFWETQTAP